MKGLNGEFCGIGNIQKTFWSSPQIFDLRPKLRFLLLELLVRQQREIPLVGYWPKLLEENQVMKVDLGQIGNMIQSSPVEGDIILCCLMMLWSAHN